MGYIDNPALVCHEPSSSSGSTGAEKNSDGTVTVRYKLPYASMFVKNVDSYIACLLYTSSGAEEK